MKSTEIWRSYPNDDYYEVSNLGRVRRWKEELDWRGYIFVVGGVRNGYLRVHREVEGGKNVYYTVSRMVLETFVGPCPEGMECCHEDGKKSNNKLNNLRWDTRRSNIHDIIKHGRASYRKLTMDDVKYIREASETHSDLAKRFGVSRSTITKIKLLQRYV